MTFLNIFKKTFPALKLLFPAVTAALLVSAEARGQNFLKNPHHNSAIRKEKCSLLDINIGFPTTRSTVCLSSDCLFPQIVFFDSTTTIHAGSAVEPTIAVNPKNRNHIVACWQQDRISNTGALEGAIAYSKNGGKKWKKTAIPLQLCEGGINQRISDTWLSYAPDGSRLYLCALALNATTDPNTQNQNNVVVSVSKDNGVHWSAPHFLFASQGSIDEPTGNFPNPDKCSITADRNRTRNAYAVWSLSPRASSFHADTIISRTRDGGKTWSPNELLYNPFPDLVATHLSNGVESDCNTINNIIVVQPKVCNEHKEDPRLDGDLLNFLVRRYAKPGAPDKEAANDEFPFPLTLFDIALVRSKNLGITWDKTATIITPFNNASVFTGGYTYNNQGQITGGVGDLLRTGDITSSYNINPKNGNLYVAFQTGQFRADQLPQIGFLTSRDGGHTWSHAAQVSRTPPNSPNPQAFTPFVAISENGHVGILYFDFRNDQKNDHNMTKTDAWLAIYKEVSDPVGGSTAIGLDFIREQRLSKKSYVAQNGPQTTSGIMTNGDYAYLVAEGNQFYACYTESFDGPFSPPTTLLDVSDPNLGQGILLLDDNYRTAPFFSLVKP